MTKTTKRTLLIVAIAMVLVVLLGFLTQGFQQWSWDSMSERFEAKRNPDNLIQIVDLKSHRSDTSDIKVNVDELGVVKLNGTAEADEDFVYSTVSLPAGTYTFTGAPDGSRATYFLALKVGDTVYRSDLGTPIVLDSTTQAQVVICVKEGTSFNNVKIMPVLVVGDEAGAFYE